MEKPSRRGALNKNCKEGASTTNGFLKGRRDRQNVV